MEELYSSFVPSTYAHWLEQIRKDLKSDDTSRFESREREGLRISPLGHPEASTKPLFIGAYRRPHHPEFAYANDWEMEVALGTDDLVKTNKRALELLSSGATSLRFQGIGISNQEELQLVLRQILPDAVQLHFDAGEGAPALLFMLIDAMQQRSKLDLKALRGSVMFDVPGDWFRNGNFQFSESDDWAVLESMIQASTASLPSFRTLVHDGRSWHECGGAAVSELAFSLSAFQAAFQRLSQTIEPGQLASVAALHLASGSDYFLNLAKFRAARLLWHMFLEAYGLDSTSYPLEIYSHSAQRNKTLADPYNNVLRASTEGMAAVSGGADNLCIGAHDALFNEENTDALRLGLNLQHLMREESRLDKVCDPASGSWYIDTLTTQLCEKAWERFLEIEQAGGYLAALRKGSIQETLQREQNQLRHDVRTRRRVLVGTSQFADAQAHLPALNLLQRDPLLREPAWKTLEPYRESETFERIRLHLQHSARNKAFLAVFGDAKMRDLRAGFARDFVALAGMKSTVGDPQVHVLDQLQSNDARNASVIILCAGDGDYAAAVEMMQKDRWPDAPIWIAGKSDDALKASGIQAFIHLGCDAEAVFRSWLQEFTFIQP